jgi:hypothetical protein
MSVQKSDALPPPPGVIGSLRAGFDVVSSHVWLIFLPIALDVFLWLGPRLSVGDLYSSVVSSTLEIIKTQPLPAQNIQSFSEAAAMVTDVLNRFNWFSWLRTFPIGISSIEAFGLPKELPLQTPLGVQEVIQASSLLPWLGWTILLGLAGWILGSLYFRWVSVTALGEEEAGIGPLRALTQTILLSVIWIGGLMMILFPLSLALALLNTINPSLGNAVLFVFLILSYWLIVPLFFMPHGIFTRKQNALYSMFTSLRMSRFTLPTSGMFVFSVFVLARGLNYLWSIPDYDSWMRLVGIAGHAFITTALLAASFVYYRDMNVWLQDVLDKMQQKQGMPTQQV